MVVKDFIITPIFLVFFLALAYWIRPFVTNKHTFKYFIPGISVRFFGAIMLGIIYQFYYKSGDTYIYFEHGSRWIWEAFLDNPIDGFRLLTKSGSEHVPDLYKYSEHIWYYRDSHSYFVVALTAIFDLFTLHTYSASALFFAVFSFSGLWAMFSELQKKYPNKTKWLAYGILFFPSVVFWGSGILKDTLTIGALGWLTWALIRWIDGRHRSAMEVVVMLIASWLIFSIKEYIIICYIPLVFVWLYFKYVKKIQSIALKALAGPVLLCFFGLIGFISLNEISKNNAKYSLDNVAERARITAFDIRYGSGSLAGGDGGYDIGLPDGTFSGMIKLAPAAVNVSLFRPYIWEIKNPLMALAALESLFVTLLTLWLLLIRGGLKQIRSDPFLIFCVSFALIFAFAVGVSTFNFGTLMRYKIPMIPFFIVAIIVSKKEKS